MRKRAVVHVVAVRGPPARNGARVEKSCQEALYYVNNINQKSKTHTLNRPQGTKMGLFVCYIGKRDLT